MIKPRILVNALYLLLVLGLFSFFFHSNNAKASTYIGSSVGTDFKKDERITVYLGENINPWFGLETSVSGMLSDSTNKDLPLKFTGANVSAGPVFYVKLPVYGLRAVGKAALDYQFSTVANQAKVNTVLSYGVDENLGNGFHVQTVYSNRFAVSGPKNKENSLEAVLFYCFG